MAAKKLFVREAHCKRATGTKVNGQKVIMETFVFSTFERKEKPKKKNKV